jgi:cytochrome oxidase Cu insertion factor (SCO1/SenC/PrrC family)
MKKSSPGIYLYAFWTVVTVSWWALAFWPVDVSPGWLTIAREVCFGVRDSGLPDTAGWMTLMLAPLGMLIGIFVVWGDEIVDSFGMMRRHFWGAVCLGVLIGAPLASAVWIGKFTADAMELSRADEGAFDASNIGAMPPGYPRLNRTAPDFSLVDQHGNTVSPADWQGKVVIMTFAYAHCATVCPMVVHRLVRAMEMKPDYPVQPVIVTLDPWRDTPSSLASLVKRWELPDGYQLLSGSPEAVSAMLEAYNAGGSRDEQTGEIAHPPLYYVIDTEGKLAYGLNNPPVDWLVEAGRRVATAGPTTN